MLELACGTGQHAAHFAKHLGDCVHWLPTDVSDELFWTVLAYCAALPNVDAPRLLDARQGSEPGDPWGLPPSSVDVVIAINMVTMLLPTPSPYMHQTMCTSPLNSNFLWCGFAGTYHALAGDRGVYSGVGAMYTFKLTLDHAMQGLFAGCGHVLKPGGRLFCYGPFKGLNFRTFSHTLLADNNVCSLNAAMQ